MATLGWIDFSRDHRNRIGSVLDLLKEEGLVDELGLGTLRDALANNLFPGISTIQSRAKYFFIVPYILQDYQASKSRRTPASKFLEQREYEVMWYLAEKYNYQRGSGVIGITKKKPQKIARRPSGMYWNGLYTYQFIDTKGLATESYLKRVANISLESMLADTPAGDDGQRDDRDADFENNFQIKVPIRKDWEKDLTLDLDRTEAEFFRDRIITLSKQKLIAELLTNNKLWEVFRTASDFMVFARAAVDMPLRQELRELIILAHDFSQLSYGVHVAYNCQLQNKVFKNRYYDDDWKDWKRNLSSSMIDYKNFDPNRVIDNSPTTRETTKVFIRNWWNEACSGFPDLKKRDHLNQQQEALVKGAKARLRWEKTEDVKAKTWTGLHYFDYRFNTVRTIIQDIRAGLRR